MNLVPAADEWALRLANVQNADGNVGEVDAIELLEDVKHRKKQSSLGAAVVTVDQQFGEGVLVLEAHSFFDEVQESDLWKKRENFP